MKKESLAMSVGAGLGIRGRSYWVLLLAAGGILVAVLYKRYLLFSNYENPPPVITYSLLFEYLAFVAIAYIFPWSLERFQQPARRATMVVATALAFTASYLLILASLEWLESGRSYSWGNGARFTLQHSSPYVLVIFGLIASFLYYLNGRYKLPATGYLQKLEYRLKNQVQFVSLSEIELLASDGNYVAAVDRAGNKYLVRGTLQSLEEQIDPERFVRVHRKYLVHPGSIQSVESDAGGGYVLKLSNQMEVKMSKNYIHLISDLKARAALS